MKLNYYCHTYLPHTFNLNYHKIHLMEILVTLWRLSPLVNELCKGLSGKESACNAGDAGDTGSIPGLGRSPGEGNGNLLQLSCLKNPMDRGAWWATVHGVTKRWTQVSTYSLRSFSSVQSLSRVQLFATPWTAARQASLPISSSQSYSNSCPLSQWFHPTIPSSVIPFSSCLHLSQHQGLFKWVKSSNEVAKVLKFQLQHQSFQWTPRTDLL